jgi:hypothetical protein
MRLERFPHAARLAFHVATLQVNTMELTTLITACSLTVDPKIMHALTWHQSGGEPWAVSVSGQHRPQVLRSMEDAVRTARDSQPNTVVIRVGLTGLPGTPRSVTAAMFTPCSNIASAARQIAQLVEVCRTSTNSKGDPNHCAIAAYHGSWDRPDNGFADMVLATADKGDAPDFEMPDGTGNDTGEVSSSGRPTSRNTPPATAPSRTPRDDERARQSSLFPVMAKPSDSSPSERPASDRTAFGEQKNEARTVPPTAAPPHVDSVFVPRSVQQSAPKS